MGRNSKSSKHNPVCEKLLRAFGVYPKIIKLSPPPASRQEEQPNYPHQIHIHEVKVAPEMEKKQNSNNKLGNKSGNQDVNDVFSDYINRAKRRLGSISSKKHDSSSKGKENLKDDRRFSDYIIRARNKLKATSSSVGFTKTSSIK